MNKYVNNLREIRLIKIINELTELRELETAKILLYKTQPMELLRFSNKERFQKLDKIVNRSFYDPKEV